MRNLILGHRGMVGSALCRALTVTSVFEPNADWRRDSPVRRLTECMAELPVDVLYLCAARVGGIGKNVAEPGTMIYDNLMIQCNVIEAARQAGVKLIVFLGSSCIYSPHYGPIPECHLLNAPLEPTNEAYAVAKIAGIKMLEAYKAQYGMEYLAVMPCNLYGPGDNFDPETSHFLPGMIRKFHNAKVTGAKAVTLWGTGSPRRELMHVDDCARIITELVANGARGLINVGAGTDLTIVEYAGEVARAVGFGTGQIVFDESKPDGVRRKLLDVSLMQSFGCTPKIGLDEGLKSTYRWFLENTGNEVTR